MRQKRLCGPGGYLLAAGWLGFLLLSCWGGSRQKAASSAPAITSVPPVYAWVGREYTYAIMASGDPAPTFEVSGLPSWLMFDGTNTISGVPVLCNYGITGLITITATNSEGSDTQQFRILVSRMDPALIGWWKLDEESGDTAEDSAGTNDGTLYGDPAWQPSDGRIGGALRLDGVDDYILVSNEPNFDISDHMTVAAWMRVDAITKNWRTIVTKGTSAWRLLYDAFTERVRFKCGDVGAIVTEAALSDGGWHHVAGVYDGTTLAVYIDGCLVRCKRVSGPIGTNDVPVCIGGGSALPDRTFDGLIDDVRIYNRALTHGEFLALTRPEDGIAAAIAGESAVSPLFIEGLYWSPSGAEYSITATGPSGSATVTMLSDTRFFTDVPLDPSSPGEIRLTHSETGAIVKRTVTWAPTHLVGKSFSDDEVAIRRGDSLLLTAHDPAHGRPDRPLGPFKIDADGDGQVDWTGEDGESYPALYDEAGEFVATVWEVTGDGDQELGSLTVVVIEVDLLPPIPCQVGYQREKQVLVTPASRGDYVCYDVGDPNLLEVSLKATTATGVVLLVKATHRGTPVLIARLDDEGGPIVAWAEIDEFTLDVPARCCTVINHGTSLGTSRVTIRPFLPDLTFRFEMIASQARFAGGATLMDAGTSTDFVSEVDAETGETVGLFPYDLQVPPGEGAYVFDITVREGNVPGQGDQVGYEHIDGCAARATIAQLGLSTDHDYPRNLRMTVVTECHCDGCPHCKKRALIAGGPPEATMPVFTRPEPDSVICDDAFDCSATTGTVLEELVNGLNATVGSYDVKIEYTLFPSVIRVSRPKLTFGRPVEDDFVEAHWVLTVHAQTQADIDAIAENGTPEEAPFVRLRISDDDDLPSSFKVKFYVKDVRGKIVGGIFGRIKARMYRISRDSGKCVYSTAKPVVLVREFGLIGNKPTAIVVLSAPGGELWATYPKPK